MYVITKCAHCSAPIPTTAPRCVRCHTRYCNPDCQLAHWEDGHKKKCKKIARNGGAEEAHAIRLHEDAALDAVHQTLEKTTNMHQKACYICGKGGDVVRNCGCNWREASKDKGYAHVACLVKQAANRAGSKQWKRCGVCGVIYLGAVSLTLAAAYWKRYANAPTTRQKVVAYKLVASGLCRHSKYVEAIPLLEACLDDLRHWFNESATDELYELLCDCLDCLHRKDDLLVARYQKYTWYLGRLDQLDANTLGAADMLAHEYIDQSMFKEGRHFIRAVLSFVPNNLEMYETLSLRCSLAETYYKDGRFLKAAAILQNVDQRVTNVYKKEFSAIQDFRNEMRTILDTQDRCDAGLVAARAIAVAECAAVADGARCYLCLDDGSREGLVLGCGCRETKYVAHLSCMARFARRSVEFDDLSVPRGVLGGAIDRWTYCPVCQDEYTGHVLLAMAWQYLRTCSTLSVDDSYRQAAMIILGTAKFMKGAVEEAKADLEYAEERLNELRDDEEDAISIGLPLACAREMLDRCAETLQLDEDLHAAHVRIRILEGRLESAGLDAS